MSLFTGLQLQLQSTGGDGGGESGAADGAAPAAMVPQLAGLVVISGYLPGNKFI